MRRSSERVLTRYVGRLQRPESLTKAMAAHPSGGSLESHWNAEVRGKAVLDVSRDGRSLRITLAAGVPVGALEINVNCQRGGSILPHGVVVGDLIHIEALVDRAVHGAS